MDALLFAHIQKQCPVFNHDVAIGLACKQMKHAEQYIDNILRCAEVGFPQGFRYVGCSRVTPQEAFNTITMKRTTKLMYEFAHSDIYLMKYLFEYNGEPLKPRYLFLPYVKEGGIITIKGSTFSISPVLADKAISVGEDSIYIPMNRDKLTFKRLTQHFILDGNRKSTNVIWSNIHHAWKKSNGLAERKTIMANATLPHYLFCKHGLRGTFWEHSKTEVIVGDIDVVNETNYPPDVWHICESTGDKPAGIYTRQYQQATIRLAIRRKDYNQSTEGLIGGFFYVVDRFPERMKPEYLDDTSFWRVLMGHVIYATHVSEGKLLNNVDIHMESLDGYIDNMVREWLREDGVSVLDIYQLFSHMVDTFSTRIMESALDLASMYDKRLMVLRYVLIDIIKAIFGMMFGLQVAAKKLLTIKDIEKTIHRFLKPTLIIGINHKHNEVSSVSSPSDCMAFKITSNLVLQTDIGGGSSAAKSIKLDSSKILHTSIATVGQVNNLPKGDPTGRRRINPFVTISDQDTTTFDPSERTFMDKVAYEIRR